MFDFLKSDGGDKKQELEENIEQIRQKVQQEQEASGGQSRTRRGADQAASNPSGQEFAEADTYDDTQDYARNDDFSPDEPDEPEPPVQNGEPTPSPQRMDEQSFERGGTDTEESEREQQEWDQQTANTERSPRSTERDFEQSNESADSRQEYDYQEKNAEHAERDQQDYSANRSSASKRQRRGGRRRQRSSTRASESTRDQLVQVTSRGSKETQETRREQPEASDGTDSGPRAELEKEIPEPPEVKDLDIPEIERGPLFITVSKFKNALGTLSDMKHISQQMQEQVNGLEETLEQDREIEEELRQVLEKTIDDTEVIQNVVSPKQRDSSE